MSANLIAQLSDASHTLDLALRELSKIEALTTAAILAWSHKETYDPELLFELVRDVVEVDRILLKGGDCNRCGWWRELKAKKRGCRIPGGRGKCTRPEGLCGPGAVVMVRNENPDTARPGAKCIISAHPATSV